MDLPIPTGRAQGLGERQKILVGEGNWTCVKEVWGWTFDMEVVIFALPECKLQELLSRIELTVTQRHVGRKDIDRLVENICSMHLAVTGVVAHM